MPIFFSLDPDVFNHYKSCTITNGTTIYSNHSIPDDCSCVAPIHADPDFGGPGVIATFCFLAWVSIFTAAIPAFYSISAQWKRSRPPKRILKFFQAILSIQVHENNPRDSVGTLGTPGGLVVAHPETDAAVVAGTVDTPAAESGAETASETWTEKPPILLPVQSVVVPRPVMVANVLLASLTDIQIVLGIAIVLAALAQFDRISFYHEQFAVNLWWLTLNSVWVSRIDYNEDSEVMASWKMQARRCMLILSVVLSCVLQLLVALREENDWDPLNGHKCYVDNSLADNFGQNIFWFAGSTLYGLVLLTGVFQSSRRWIDENVFERIPASLSTLSKRMYSDRSAFMQKKGVVTFLRLCFSTKAFVSWWIIVQFLSIWSAGNTSHAIELIVYTIFAGSNTWWVIALKVSNRHLVVGNESRWTLGQSLPIMLTGLVAFAGLDAIS